MLVKSERFTDPTNWNILTIWEEAWWSDIHIRIITTDISKDGMWFEIASSGWISIYTRDAFLGLLYRNPWEQPPPWSISAKRIADEPWKFIELSIDNSGVTFTWTIGTKMAQVYLWKSAEVVQYFWSVLMGMIQDNLENPIHQ